MRGCARRSTPTRSASASCTRPRSTCWSISTASRRCRACRRTAGRMARPRCGCSPNGMCPAVGLDGRRRRLGRGVARSARAGRGGWAWAGDRAARLSCRKCHAARRARRDRAVRPARFPGRAGRSSGLRSGVGAGGCAARRPARARAGDDRPLHRARPVPTSGFERAYWALAAQRNTRILGVFCRLWKRDGKTATRHSSRACGAFWSATWPSPALAPVRDWFDANIPPSARAAAWQEAAA